MEKGEPFCTVGGMQIGAATVESSIESPQKIKNGTALWLGTSTSENLSKDTQITNSKECKHPYVHCSVIYNSQDFEAGQVTISIWMDKATMVHLHNGILLGHKNDENFTLATAGMDLENIMLSEISQPEKDNTNDFTHMWNPVNKLD